jgi:hypothetical protein
MVRCGVVLLCRPWWHCRHGDGSPAVLRDVVSAVAFVITSWPPEGVVPELVTAPRSSIAWFAYGAGGHDPELRGRGSRRSDGL